MTTAIMNYNRAIGDLTFAQERLANGYRAARILIAQTALLRDRIRLGMFGVWMLIGIAYGFFAQTRSAAGWGVVIGLFVTAACNAYISYLETRENTRLDDLMREHDLRHE
jgi:hypothetical protein